MSISNIRGVGSSFRATSPSLSNQITKPVASTKTPSSQIVSGPQNTAQTNLDKITPPQFTGTGDAKKGFDTAFKVLNSTVNTIV